MREFYHVYVLITAPAKDGSRASSRLRLYVQDIIILLSEQANLHTPRAVLVTTVESCAYHAHAADCVILYVSKLRAMALRPRPQQLS